MVVPGMRATRYGRFWRTLAASLMDAIIGIDHGFRSRGTERDATAGLNRLAANAEHSSEQEIRLRCWKRPKYQNAAHRSRRRDQDQPQSARMRPAPCERTRWDLCDQRIAYGGDSPTQSSRPDAEGMSLPRQFPVISLPGRSAPTKNDRRRPRCDPRPGRGSAA